MNPPAPPEGRVVGLQPWLPWPLAASRWWTAPVRAEYLAVLRIGLAAVLLWDVVCVYWPLRHDFFGPDSLGSPEYFAYLAQDYRWNWSLLRGFADPLLSALALLTWLVTTVFLLAGLRARLGTTVADPPTLRWALVAWAASSVVAVLGIWARLTPPPLPEADFDLVMRTPLVVFGVALVFLWFGLWRRCQTGPQDPWVWPGLIGCAAVAGLLVAVGHLKSQADLTDPAGPEWLRWSQTRWLAEPRGIDFFMAAWAVAALLLLLGLGTRVSAVAVWALSLSFDNLNFYINNAGDQVRSILAFYLMLCPCGAAWSLDDWLARRWGGRKAPLYVSPWPLRLLFVQMACIYFFNGLYKYAGDEWPKGTSMHYVMGDVVLTRFSYAQLPLPLEVTSWMAWTVLAWELTFPLLVLFRWTRVAALLMGVAFHLGIWLTMELGGFAPYMLVMYLPLLPWERWLRRQEPVTREVAQQPVEVRAEREASALLSEPERQRG